MSCGETWRLSGNRPVAAGEAPALLRADRRVAATGRPAGLGPPARPDLDIADLAIDRLAESFDRRPRLNRSCGLVMGAGL